MTNFGDFVGAILFFAASFSMGAYLSRRIKWLNKIFTWLDNLPKEK